MIKNQWLKGKTFPLILAALISFLLGLFIPVEFVSWQSNNPEKQGGSLSDLNVQTDSVSLQTSQNSDNKVATEKTQITSTSARATEVSQINSPSVNLAKLGSTPKALQGKVIKEIVVPEGRKVIALTFDDGPSKERTNDILYILNSHNVKATFFVLGQNVQAYPDLTKRIVNYGHAIGNHTWSHPYAQQSKASAARQVDRTREIIEQVTGVKTELFRPPGGYMNNGLVAHAKQQKNAIVMWSSDSSDYKSSANNIVANSLRNARPGGIILLHDGGGNRWNTLVALPRLINELRKQGYEFVTIPELLAMGEPKEG